MASSSSSFYCLFSGSDLEEGESDGKINDGKTGEIFRDSFIQSFRIGKSLLMCMSVILGWDEGAGCGNEMQKFNISGNVTVLF